MIPRNYALLLNEQTLKWEVHRYYSEPVATFERYEDATEHEARLNREFWAGQEDAA